MLHGHAGLMWSFAPAAVMMFCHLRWSFTPAAPAAARIHHTHCRSGGVSHHHAFTAATTLLLRRIFTTALLPRDNQ